jgi:DeoR family transcriptional regulator, fructose operon transcriptional repressor
MYAEERHRVILEKVARDGKVSVEALSEELGVSAPTIRADLGVLEGRRLLRRTHGGAIAVETTLYEPPYAERERSRQGEKARIGKLAAARVRDHETILLDAGTTTFEIAVHLKERVGLTVVTNSLEAAWELMDAPPGHMEIIVVGGHVHARRRATLGPLAAEFLGRLQVDHAFLGVNGVHPTAGWTVVDFDAAQVKRAMMAQAREVVIVADASKMGMAAFASMGSLSSAHVLITDAPLSSTVGDALHAANVEVLVAE